MKAGSGDITRLLARSREGDREALDQLTPLIYQHLHRLAGSLVSRERRDHTLQPTALLHEAFLRMMDGAQPDWESRVHFYAFAARVMRQVLIDYARRRQAGKRSSAKAVPIDEITIAAPGRAAAVIDLEEALTGLAAIDERKARILELRYFAGFNVDDTCIAMGLSISTIRRETRLAEAWLHRELDGAGRSAGTSP